MSMSLPHVVCASPQRVRVLWKCGQERWTLGRWLWPGCPRLTEEDPSPATPLRSKKSGVSRTAQRSQCELRQQAASWLCLPVEWTESWSSAKRSEVLRSSQTDLILMELHPDETYNLRIFAVNSVGRSDASNVLNVKTKIAGKATSCLTFRGSL